MVKKQIISSSNNKPGKTITFPKPNSKSNKKDNKTRTKSKTNIGAKRKTARKNFSSRINNTSSTRIFNKVRKDKSKPSRVPISHAKHKLLDLFYGNKKRIFYGVLLITAILILLIGFYFFGIRSHFLADNELFIELSPIEYSLSILDNQTADVQFNLRVHQPFSCKTTCNLFLNDLSKNVTFQHDKRIDFDEEVFNYKLPVPRHQEGQQLYEFKVSCYDVASSTCPSEERIYNKNVLITINHNLSQESIQLKNDVKNELNDFITNLESTEELLLESEKILQQLNYSLPNSTNQTNPNSSLSSIEFQEEQSLFSLIISAKQNEQSLNQTKQSLIRLWKNYDFDGVRTKIQQESQSNSDFQQEVFFLNNYSLQVRSLLNSTIELFIQLNNYDVRLLEAEKFYTAINKTQELDDLDLFRQRAMVLKNNFTQRQYFSLEGIYNETNLLKHQVSDFLDDYTSEESVIISKTEGYLNKINNILYYKENGFFPLQSIVPNNQLRSSIGSICLDFESLQQNITQVNNFSLQERINQYPFLNNSSLLTTASNKYIIHLFLKQENSSHIFVLNSSFEHAPTDYPVMINGTLSNTYNISNISESSFRQISPISTSNQDLFEQYENISYRELCGFYSSNSSFIQTEFFNTSLISDLPNLSLISQGVISQQTIIPSLEPLCCFENNCSPCCQGSACANEFYPVIFVHGHSFDKSNSPELALTRLSMMQSRLEEDGFINAGQISQYSDIGAVPAGDWGRVNNPISVLVTYYYITHNSLGGVEFTTQKTDSIENYAIRLRDMINLVKKRTGKDKVVLVAHSMGGLVCREYLYLFGGSSVDKLVELGSPNKGIEADVKTFCPVTGGKKECEDMNYDSPFMARLNSPTNIPSIPVFTITAHGCEMKAEGGTKEDGDGVVLARNVPLSYATNYDVNGTCTDFLQSNLHMRFVNPDLYPETYTLLRNILLS